MSRDGSVKWGVIGAGGIADRRTIPEGIVPAANSELVAVMDIDPARGGAFAEAILSDTAPPVSPEDGNRSMEVLLTAYTSAREGRTVRVSPG